MSSVHVFVYGTLKPGYDNHNVYCRDRLIDLKAAKVKGELYDLAAGYPGMTHGDRWVQGFLLILKEDGKTLQDLDDLEDYNPEASYNLYQREMTDVFSPDGVFLQVAWAYYMAIATIKAMHGKSLMSGNWSP